MTLKLYGSLTSPYTRKVRVAAEELGLGDQIEMVAADPFSPQPEFLAANPLSKIPALVTDKGDALPDSSLILEYLQSIGYGMAALPRISQKRWSVLRRARVAEGIMDAAVATVLEKRRPEGIVYTSHLDRQAQAIQRSTDLLNHDAATLATSGPMGIVEITAGVALAYLDFRMPYLEWRKGREALAAWHETFSQRPSMIKTQPPG